MSSLQRIFHVHTKRRFSHLPGELLLGCSHGNPTESTATLDIPAGSPDRATSSPARGGRSPFDPQMLTSRPAAPAGRWLLRRPTSATLARKQSRASHRQGWGASPREAGQWSVCLLKLGGRDGLEVKIAWNVSPRAVQTALSASSGNRLGGWDKAQVWTTGLTLERCCREGNRGMPPGQTSLLCRCCPALPQCAV